VAVGHSIGPGIPPGPTGGHVERGIEIFVPSPRDRPKGLRRRIGGLYRGRILPGAIPQLVVSFGGWVHIAVGAVPEGGFVIEVVVANASLCGRTVMTDQVRDPLLDEGRADGDARVRRVVAGDVCAVGVHTVAAVGVVWINVLLRTVLGDAEAAGDGPGL